MELEGLELRYPIPLELLLSDCRQPLGNALHTLRIKSDSSLCTCEKCVETTQANPSIVLVQAISFESIALPGKSFTK